MQTQFGAERTYIATSSHEEGLATPIAELEFALGARKVHASPAAQRILEVALWTADAILCQVFAQSFGLRFRVVGFFPLHEALARDPFVLLLPLECAPILNGNRVINQTRQCRSEPFYFHSSSTDY